MATYRLTTKYENDMDKEAPHAYYPRPSMVRDSFLSLNGEWSFGTGKREDAGCFCERILLPFPPESPLSGICRGISPDEYMHYERRVTLPSGFMKDRLILHFGAIDQAAWVYVDGRLVAERLGGYIPFSADITDAVSGGEFLLHVVCRDALDKRYPYGKQTAKRGGMWYTPVSGIWQSVWLESLPNDYICNLKFTQIEGGVHLDVFGVDEFTVKLLGDIPLIGAEGGVLFGDCRGVDILPESPRLWSPEDPYIYRVEIEAKEDRVESYFAIRSFSVGEFSGKRRLALNGKPYVCNGLLDQGYYPDGIFLPATKEGYADDIGLAKSLGFNTLRKHIKIEPEIFYYLCDTMGILVFQDMVNSSDYSFIRDTVLPTIGIQRLSDKRLHRDPKTREIFERTMKETAELLYNHPSVVYYTVFNEGWGQFSADEEYKKLRAIDPTRVIDATSGWWRESESDVDSRHIYFKALKPKKLDGRPLVISEFGGYSYRVPGHVFSDANYGYRTFTDADKFEDAVIRLYEDEVLPLVREGASAFIYTQVSDVEDETNGFVTYDRRVVKVDKERIYPVISKCSGEV